MKLHFILNGPEVLWNNYNILETQIIKKKPAKITKSFVKYL